jgi:hypothetical protein
MKLSHLTKDQKRARTNTMAWRREATNSLERDHYYLYQAAIDYINNPSKKERLVRIADCICHNTNRLKRINKELEKYEPHNPI